MGDINRTRLVNAVVFFAKNTRYCGKIKLFKLLYLMDFEHFRATGTSVTGAEYAALQYGPVPEVLFEEWDDPEEDFRSAVEIVQEQAIDFTRQAVRPLREFDDGEFTPRQLRIMRGLAEQHRDAMSHKMIDVTHAENGAWDQVWAKGAGRNRLIPYELALAEDAPNREAALERTREDRMRADAIATSHHRIS